uniref:Uncharacterized protein n=1 Tax=Anguilla anguilla TaxID=7936 RepID=A0A0E9VVG7_ANGAN
MFWSLKSLFGQNIYFFISLCTNMGQVPRDACAIYF